MVSLKRLKIIAFLGVFLAFGVVSLGAWTRLVDAGLGCPDWPGCYGFAIFPMTETEIAQANELYPERKFEIEKAIPEVVHRYFAGFLGLLIIGIFVMTFYLKPYNALVTKLTGALVVLVLCQSTFGYLTVSLKLWPQVVTMHLLGGFATTTLLFLTYMKLKDLDTGSNESYGVSTRTFGLLNFAFPVLVAQIILGVWLSSNYAAFACPDFPLCQGQILPDTNFQMGFNFMQSIGPDYLGGKLDHQSRTAIHLVHRLGAILVTFYFVALIASFYSEKLKKYSYVLSFFLFLQLLLGVSNIIYRLPLYVAIAHNLGALFLLLAISYFRLKISVNR
ncbi:MAG: cytochrome oxidase assembly protein [Proteobacteria bacterium]|nr:cytochrome oxidase assembly protein [Pseudomonadota bacterium]RZO98522.1 MAG: heme A synthase [Gammaproteobacteria bacterium]